MSHKKAAQKWIDAHHFRLGGKTVAVTGTTGGLGTALCRDLASLGASLILLDRNPVRSAAFRDELVREYGICAECITTDLSDISSVKQAVSVLKDRTVDVLIHNAGAYSVPRFRTSIGTGNVFQINFLSPYYMTRELLPGIRQRGGRVVCVGSIAHRYTRTDPDDIDFYTVKSDAKVYGNAKRYLMFSLMELFSGESSASLAVCHPGISFTNITAHYPPILFALIKYPMKVIFMKPEKACLSILQGVFEKTGMNEWIGPSVLDVWGFPKKSILYSVTEEELQEIQRSAQEMYLRMKA